jgi:hypothetical protein
MKRLLILLASFGLLFFVSAPIAQAPKPALQAGRGACLHD